MNKEQLEDHLSYLRLNTIRQTYPEQVAKAERDNLSYLDFLQRLVEEEVLEKKERAAKKRVQMARFPVIKTLAQVAYVVPNF